MVSPEPSLSQASVALRRPSVGCSVSTISSFSSTRADIALKFFSSAATLSASGATAARSSRLDARLTKPTRSAKPCDTGTWVETSFSSVIIDWLASPPIVIETMVMSAWAFSPAGSSTSLSLVWAACAAFTISSPCALSLRRSSTAPSSAASLVFMAAYQRLQLAIDCLIGSGCRRHRFEPLGDPVLPRLQRGQFLLPLLLATSPPAASARSRPAPGSRSASPAFRRSPECCARRPRGRDRGPARTSARRQRRR